MDPGLLSATAGSPHRPAWQRPRRCLLKGCDHWFRPTRPQCRYCSPACRQAARCWYRWRAQQTYRASPKGRQHRQQQARRYRQRHPPPPPPPPPPACATATAAPAAAGVLAPPEGHPLLEKSDAGPQRSCDRPGCYVLFPAGPPWSRRHFCSVLCCRALRSVLQREQRRHRRRQRGLQPPGRKRRPRCCSR
jgi:hypothetical protein